MSVKFTHYGGMTLLMERDDGYKILVDPFISGNPHTKAVVEDFRDVNLILCSHVASDHYGDLGEIFSQSNATVVLGRSSKELLNRQGYFDSKRCVNTDVGDSRVVDGIEINTVFAIHKSRLDNPDGSIGSMSAPLSFVIDVEPGVICYHQGDTALFSDVKLIRELYKPNIMACGIHRIRTGVSAPQGPREAAYATSWVGPDVVIPGHYPVGEEGQKALADYKRHMETLAPKVQIMDRIDSPFVFKPFSASYI